MAASGSDSSEDDEQMQRLRDAVAPESCLPRLTPVEKNHDHVGVFLQDTISEGKEKSKGAVKNQPHSFQKSSQPSVRKKIYGDMDNEYQPERFGLDSGARDRIAKSLHNSLFGELEEGENFSIAGEVKVANDTGVRLFKKSPLVSAANVESANKSVATSNKKLEAKKKRKLSSSDSDDEKMADLASVAISADTIRMNSLTDHADTKKDDGENISNSTEDNSSSNPPAHDSLKKKKKKKKSKSPESVTDIT